MNKKKILAIAPHTDDIELGCGATLSKFSRDYDIDVIGITSAQPLSTGDPVAEFYEAMSYLNANVTFLNYEPRILYSRRQDLLDYLWSCNKKTYYDIVFCPSSYDHHQDHQVVYEETFRAFKHSTILGYELPWNNRIFRTDVFVTVSDNDLDFKIKMLNAYKTQQERAFMCKDYVYDIARTRGLQAGCQYAESFEAIRIIM